MDLTSLILFLVIGLVAGWLAGRIMKGGGFRSCRGFNCWSDRRVPRRLAILIY